MSDNVPPYPNVRNELEQRYYSHNEGHDSQTQDTTCDIDEITHSEIAMKYVKQRQGRYLVNLLSMSLLKVVDDRADRRKCGAARGSFNCDLNLRNSFPICAM